MKNILLISLLFNVSPAFAQHVTSVGLSEYDRMKDAERGVNYLTELERFYYRVKIKNGQLLNYVDEPLSFSKLTADMFVVDEKGQMYAVSAFYDFRKDSQAKVITPNAYSSFLAGGPVLMAGTMEVRDGKIISIEAASSPYNITRSHLEYFISSLHWKGFDLSEIKYKLGDKWIDASSPDHLVNKDVLRVYYYSCANKFGVL